jgi:hypothetical protein
MSNLPQFDPSWTRRPRPVPKDDTSLVPTFVVVAVVLAGMWFVRQRFELQAAHTAAENRARELAAAAAIRPRAEEQSKRAHQNGLATAQSISRADEFTQSSFNGQAIHRCAYLSSEVYQASPCQAPWVDEPQTRGYSRRDEVAEQAYIRQKADAKLRAEESRFAALTGQESRTWQPGYVANPREVARQRCEWTKAQREEAYRIVGNNRTFDFIRHWNDLVVEACKAT